MSELVETLGRVGVLYGGVSSEREISLASGSAVSESLKRLSIENILIDVADDLLNKLKLLKPDRVFVALHGPGGEDGTIQGLLEYMQIPYPGSGVFTSDITMEKLSCKLMGRYLGLPTTKFMM